MKQNQSKSQKKLETKLKFDDTNYGFLIGLSSRVLLGAEGISLGYKILSNIFPENSNLNNFFEYMIKAANYIEQIQYKPELLNNWEFIEKETLTTLPVLLIPPLVGLISDYIRYKK